MQNCECHLHHQNPSSDQNFMQYPKVFGYLIPALVGILGACAQGGTKPLCETHIANMWTFLSASILYCCALAADYNSRLGQANSSKLWGVIAVISGSLSSISLISIFLPRFIDHIILYVAWITAAIIIVGYQYGRLFKNASCWLYREILKAFFCNIWYWFQANNILTEQQRLPV